MRWKTANCTESIWYCCRKRLPRTQGHALPRNTAGATRSHSGHPTAPAHRWESRATSTPPGEGRLRWCRSHVLQPRSPELGASQSCLPGRWLPSSALLQWQADGMTSQSSCPSPGRQEGSPSSPGAGYPQPMASWSCQGNHRVRFQGVCTRRGSVELRLSWAVGAKPSHPTARLVFTARCLNSR